jgi:phosphoenolpyruvate phosphomutase
MNEVTRSAHGAAAIRSAMTERRTLTMIGVHDALSARLVERAGYDGVYVSSYTTEAAAHLHPDLGLMSKSDRCQINANIASAVGIPVFADIEEGWGGPIQVATAVAEFERAGAAMVHLDDQISPGICPYLPGVPDVTLESTQAMCAKIEAAVEARQGDMVIVARSDITGLARDGAFTDEQRVELARRSNEYLAAGADAAMVGTFSTDDIRWFAEHVDGPLVALCEDALPHSVETFTEAGYLVVLAPLLLLFSAIKGMNVALQAFKESKGDWAQTGPHRIETDEFYDIIDWAKYQRLLGRARPTAAPAG